MRRGSARDALFGELIAGSCCVRCATVQHCINLRLLLCVRGSSCVVLYLLRFRGLTDFFGGLRRYGRYLNGYVVEEIARGLVLCLRSRRSCGRGVLAKQSDKRLRGLGATHGRSANYKEREEE